MKENAKKGNGFFNKALTLRIVSLLCAILLWFYVSEVESPTSEKSIDSVAITLRNKDIMTAETGLSVISDALYHADIVLSGKKSTLSNIDYEDITATVDLSQLTEPGSHELQITVTPPAGTKIVSTTPHFITVSVDKTVSQPFDISTDIYYSSIYEIGECVITDTQSKAVTSVTVSGPETEVSRIQKVVARVDFGSITSSVEAKTNLICLDINGEEITDVSFRLTPQSVIVKQPVYMTKKLTLTASQAGNTFSDSQISFRVNPSSVEVKGDPKLLSELSEISLTPIDEQAVIGESLINTVNALIKLPDGLELVGTQNTATITVSVKNVKRQYLTFFPEDITVLGKPDYLDIEIDSEAWTIAIINASDKELTKDDIKLELELLDLTTDGKQTVAITPKFVEETSNAYFPGSVACNVTYKLSQKEAGE